MTQEKTTGQNMDALQLKIFDIHSGNGTRGHTQTTVCSMVGAATNGEIIRYLNLR